MQRLPKPPPLATQSTLRGLVFRTVVRRPVDTNSIKYRVSNLTDATSLNLTGISGPTLAFFVTNRGLAGYTDPRFARPILYEVVAYLDSGAESDPIYIAQDIKSQIRQEYIDRRRFFPAFARTTPMASDIGNSSFYGPTFLTSPFADANHDYVRFGLTIIKQSRSYFDRVKAAGIPARLTSHWRNPRFNDSLGASNDSELNSYHQSGDAIDINPYREEAAWPAGAGDYEEARAMIKEATAAALSDARVIFHGEGVNEHVHIQPGT